MNLPSMNGSYLYRYRLSNAIQCCSRKSFYILKKTPLNLLQCSSIALQLFTWKAQTATRTTSYLSIFEIVFIFGLVAELIENSADRIRQKNVNFLKQTNARGKAQTNQKKKKMLFTLRIRPDRYTHTYTHTLAHIDLISLINVMQFLLLPRQPHNKARPGLLCSGRAGLGGVWWGSGLGAYLLAAGFAAVACNLQSAICNTISAQQRKNEVIGK